MEEYIKFNTDKRKEASNSFDKEFFKMMINGIYGKTMENLRKRINIRLINNAKDCDANVKCESKPNFLSQKIFDKNLAAVHQIKPVLTLNKPIYVGFSILDLSKLLIYKFHYGYVKNKFDAKLLFTHTDSLVYEIKGKNGYEDYYIDKDFLDFSEYSVNSEFYDPSNKKVLGKMKDEFKGELIYEFIGLKSKMYPLCTLKNNEVMKAKGINKKIRHEEFVDVLFINRIIRHNMKRIQSKLHRVGTYDVFKISLPCFDDKRYVLNNGVNTLAYFHKSIKKLKKGVKICKDYKRFIKMIKNP